MKRQSKYLLIHSICSYYSSINHTLMDTQKVIIFVPLSLFVGCDGFLNIIFLYCNDFILHTCYEWKTALQNVWYCMQRAFPVLLLTVVAWRFRTFSFPWLICNLKIHFYSTKNIKLFLYMVTIWAISQWMKSIFGLWCKTSKYIDTSKWIKRSGRTLKICAKTE